MPSRPSRPRRPHAAAIALLTASALTLGFASARADTSVTREVMKSFPDLRHEVRFRNIAGAVTVGAAEGEATTVRAVIHAAAESEGEAQKLLDAIDLNFEEKDGHLDVEARYPLDRYDTYRYPGFAHHGNSTSTASYGGKKITVTTRETRDAVALWVDLELRLERGVGVHIKELAGEIEVRMVEGPVKVENGWGDITIADVQGNLSADTGSGDVEVSRHQGEALVDTGSGQIVVEDVKGDVHTDTGSGDVVVARVTGIVQVETGSGDVELRDVAGAITIDTGSGDTRITGAAAQEVTVDTGSGTIVVESPSLFRDTHSAVARFGTGSGDVILHIDEQVSMLLHFSSGSGRVRSPRALEGRIRRLGQPGEGRYRIGGDASRVEVDTGSGDVVLRLAGE